MGPVDVSDTRDEMFWMYRQGLRLAGRFPRMATAVYPLPAFLLKNYPERMLSILAAKVASPDKSALKNRELKQVLSRSFREAFRGGLRWPATDLVLYSRSWGFRLQDIQIDVHLWHGEKDKIVPPAMGHYLANTIPNCRSTFYADEGHFSIILNRIHEIWQIF
jgi:pimeloyl-ACP methyl ester carboxylesterase